MLCKVSWETEKVDCGSGDGDGDLGWTGRGTVLTLGEEEDCAEETGCEGFDVGVEDVDCFGREDGRVGCWVEVGGSWFGKTVLIPLLVWVVVAVDVPYSKFICLVDV